MSSNKIIKIEARLSRVLFPKYPEILGRDNTYGIVSWCPMLVLEGDVETDNWGNIVVKGNYEEEIDPKTDYTIVAKEVVDPQRGKQYELMFIGHIMDLSKVSNQKAFLKSFLSDNQIAEMFKVLENPLAVIEAHDVESLKKASGIGNYIANCIIERFEDNKDNCEVYLELDGYGLTPKFIQKLIKQYKNPHKVVEIVKKNPYQLSFDVEGIGFKTADAIALKAGVSETSPERIKAYIHFLLNDLGQNGNSYITSGELTRYIFEEFGGKDNILEVYYDEDGNVIGNNVGKAIDELQEKSVIVVEDNANKANRRVYLKKYYELEKAIADNLKRIAKAPNKFKYDNWEEVVTQQENKQGWKFTDEQKAGIKLGLDNQVCFITGGAGCVDCDTEFFNGKEWKKISEYDEETDLVLQYHEEGYADLVKPSKYHKYPETQLTLITNQTGSINQCLSEGHNVYYKTEKGKFYKKPFYEIKEMHNNSKQGFRGKFLTTFEYEGKGIELSEYEIRLMVAVIADGHFPNSTNKCRMNLLKIRKKKRLEWLLNSLKLNYETKEYDNGFTEYYFNAPLRTRAYTSEWYNCNKKQFEIICDEVLHWDGSLRNNRKEFSTTVKETADFVQFAFATIGKRCTINTYDRTGQHYNDKPQYIRKSIEYVLCITQGNPEVSLRNRHKKNEFVTYKTKDGYKYCFTVDTHLLVLRRNNRIFITGNTGKSSLVSGILESLKGYSFAQTALAGKASARLQEVTGEEGFTIHRLLKFKPPYTFAHNENNPLSYDIIILDEISLVGGEIFLSLIKAIPDGTKLIILGDMGQLESIGCMNLAYDLYNSKFITTVELTKVHRQAQKSGVITASQKIRNGEPVLDKKFVGEVTMGELQDMHFDIDDNTSTTRERVMKWFKERYESDLVNDIMDIQILSPCKDRGDSSVFNINQDVQEYYNPQDGNKNEIKVTVGKDKFFYLREGDKVMCMKNNYKIRGREKEGVFNGWCGILKHVDNYTGLHEIYIPMIDDTMIFNTTDLIQGVSLSYASTIHKYQGSSAKVVIGAFDNTTPPNMRTKELLYTMWTRAEKDCVTVAQNSALYSAASNSGTSDKNTFLTELLDKN